MKTKLFFNIYYFFFLLLFTVFIISSCSSNEPKVGENNNFGIYLLADQSITWESLQGKNLDSLKLKDWITSDMIDFYDYSSHVIYLKSEDYNLFNFSYNSNTPFIVLANDKRCYCGRFGTPHDTTQPHVTIRPMALCTDLVMLEFSPPHRKDIRVNDEIKSALTSLGKFKPGITLPLSMLQHSNTLVGNFKPPFVSANVSGLYNNEDNYIYAKPHTWDIIKAGNKTYESKLVLYNQNSYFSLPADISPLDTVNYKTKTVLDPEIGYGWEYFCPFIKKGYVDENWSFSACSRHYIPASLPNGTYYCYLEYYGGMMGGNKKMRSTPMGRMWMGYMRSNTIQVKYDSNTAVCFELLNDKVVLP